MERLIIVVSTLDNTTWMAVSLGLRCLQLEFRKKENLKKKKKSRVIYSYLALFHSCYFIKFIAMTEIIAVSTETANLRMMNLNHLKIETKSRKGVVYPKFPIHALPTQMIQLMEFENKKIK